MPDQSSHLTDLRADGHKVRLYFGAFLGSVIFSATVDSTPTDQALSLTVTAVSGSAADVYRGFTVRVYRADGTTLKGVTNVRAAGTISSTQLPIRELGQADIAIVAGDVLKVYNVPFLGDKLPTDDAAFAPDGLPYTTQGSAIAPNCVSGGHRIGMVDSGQTYRSEVMAGSGSSTEDPDSAGTGTHLWTLLTATLAFAPGSVSSDANPTLRASVGYGLALHNFTDSSNGASWSQFVCFQVYESAAPPIRVIDATLDGLEETGWSADFETYAYSTLAELPDGTMVALFVRETINGVDTSYGASVAGVSHVKCLGFLSRDESALRPTIRRLRFHLQSPWQRLSGLPGFSKVITRAVGADWTTVEGLTVRLGIFHLLHYYGFVTELFDVLFDSAFLNKAYPQFFLQKQTADGQVKELAAGVDARASHLRWGALSLHTHPCFIPLASRAAVTKTLTLAEQDMLSAGIVRDHWKVIETFEGRGITAGSTEGDPLFSRYTGSTPGRGNVTVNAEKKIWDDQTDANVRTGRLAAKEDGTYLDANGALHHAVQWTPELFGSYDVFDFYKEYVATTLDANSSRRGVDLSALLYYLNRVSVRYQGGTVRITPTLFTATHAPPGATYIPTPGEVPDYTPKDNVPSPYVQPAPILPLYSGVLPTEGVCLSYGEGAAALITGLSGGSLIFDPWTTGITGSKFYDGCSNPYAYKQLIGISDAGVEYCSDQSVKAAFSLLQSNASLFGGAYIGHRIRATINANGCFLIASGSNCLARTIDKFASVSTVSINGQALAPSASDADDTACDICPCERTAGHWYALAPNPSVANAPGLYRSTDNGATWGLMPSWMDANPGWTINRKRTWFEVPYTRIDGSPNIDDAALEIWYYFAGDNHTGAKNSIYISPDRGISVTRSWLPASAEYQYSGARDVHPLSTFTYGLGNAYFLNGMYACSTPDALTTVALNIASIGTSAPVARLASINGWSSNPLPFIAYNKDAGGVVTVSLDGATVVSGLPAGWTGGIGMAELSLYTVQG